MTKKYNSGRVERTPQTGITTDRYQFLGLEQAEPNLGDPKVGPSSVGTNPIPVGQVYQAVSVDTKLGERYWTPLVGFGTTVGVISVYENGFLPGGDNKFQRIHGLNFVGSGVTVDVPPVDGPFEGVGIATIRFELDSLINQGEVGQVIYNSPSGYVDGAPDFYYEPNTQNVGIGSTIPKVKIDVEGDGFVSGVLTSHFYQTGTGAVKRTIESKLKESYISITDFGAIPNNTEIDNGIYIQAAIDAAEREDTLTTTVYVPSGTWWCSTPITISKNLTIVGDDNEKSTVIFKGLELDAVAVTVSSNGGINNIKNFVMRNLTIRSHVSNDGDNITGLLLQNNSDGRIHDCAFVRFDNGLTLEGCARMIITNNYFGCNNKTNKANHAISFRDSLATNLICTGNHFTDNEIISQTNVVPCWEKAIEILSSDGVYLNHNHLKDYNIGLYVRASGISPVGDVHSSNQYFDRYYIHCVLVESQLGDDDIRDLVFNNDYFRGGQDFAESALKINNNPEHTVIKSITLNSCRIADSKYGPGIAITNPIPQVRNLNVKNCEFRSINRGSFSTEYNHAYLCAINASITGNIFDAQDTIYLSGSGAIDGKLVVVSAGTSQYTFSDNIFYTSSDSHDVITLPEIEGRQVFGNIHNNQYLENFNGPVSNIKGGNPGNVVYQGDVGITSFVSTDLSSNGKFLKFNGSIPVWDNVPDGTATVAISSDRTNAIRYMTFVDTVSTSSTIRTNELFTYNPAISAVGVGTIPKVEDKISVFGNIGLDALPGEESNIGKRQSLGSNLFDGYLALTSGIGRNGANIVLHGKDGVNAPSFATYNAGKHLIRDITGDTEFVGINTDLVYSTRSLSIGSTTLTGTAGQRLQVDGGAYIANNVGLGTTLPQYRLDVNGAARLKGALIDFNNGAGSTGQLLQSIGTGVSWISQSNITVGNASFAGYASTTGISTYATRAGIATYADTAGISTNIKGGSTGSIPYQSSSGITTFLEASGVDGYILEYNTATNKPQWINPSDLNIDFVGIATYADNAGIATYATRAGLTTNIQNGAPGQVVYQSAQNTTAFISTSNATNKFLQFNGSIPVWTDIPGISTVAISSDTSNATRYITFVDTVSTSSTIRTNEFFTYNPFVGAVGIGTTNPSDRLDVNGTTRFRGALKDFNNNVGVAGSVLISTGVGVSWATPSSVGGGVGSATSIASETTSSNTFFPLFGSAAIGSTSTIYSADNKLEFQPSSGTFYATAFTSLSDQTQKTNIKPIENALNTVKQLQGVKYNLLDNPQESIGLIAQEVEKVLPEVVNTNANGLKTVSYGNMIALLVEAIKQQQIRIEELEKKLNE